VAAALVALAFLSGMLAVTLANYLGSTAAWWPAAGVGVVALLLLPRSWWPALLVALTVAYALANLSSGRTAVEASLLGIADAAETALVGYLLVRLVGHQLDNINALWRLFAIAFVGAVVAGLGVSATLALTQDQDFVEVLLRTIPSHGASVILIVPLVMVRPAVFPVRWVEVAAQSALLAAVTAVTFGPTSEFTVSFGPLPFFVWAALRFGERLVVLQTLVFAVVVTGLTWAGYGPFPAEQELLGTSTSNQLAQLYLICVALTGLPLALVMRQRRQALARIEASEEVFRRNFSESQVAIALLAWKGTELRFTEANDAARSVLRRTSSELDGRRVSDVLCASELESAARDVVTGNRGGWSGRLGLVDAERVRLDATLSPIQRSEDTWVFSLHLADVTEATEMQGRLAAEQAYTRAVVDTAPSMIVVTTVDGTVIAANPATTTLTGYAESELLGRPAWEVLVPEAERESTRALFGDPERLPLSGETAVQTRDSGPRTVVFSNNVYRPDPETPPLYVLTATDVTTAREHAGMINHLLSSARTIAFIGTDLTGRITLFNTGAEQMLGAESDDMTGRDFTELVSEGDLTLHSARHPGAHGFAAIIGPDGTSTPETRDWTLLPKGRPPRRVSMTTNPVTNSFGQLFGYLFVARDVTDTRRSQEILVKALRREREVVARLKDLDRAKDDFVSTVSHELRTPMSSIIGSAEMLTDGMAGDLLPAQQRMLEVIARNGDRLLNLADDLLTLAAGDDGTWQQQLARVDLGEVAHESAGAVATMLASRHLDLRLELPDHPVHVLGDPGHLERAVTNLLTNAVKFTPDGGRIDVTVTRNEAERTACIAVADTGLGIPKDELENVFAKFFRSTVVQEQAIQGTGLGLPIVKTIVANHDGHIDVTSRAGAGTTFTISLPMSEGDPAAAISAG